MNEITRSERIASERLSSLESPTRRLLMKGMAGLGATLVSSSLSEAIAAQTHQPGAPGNQVPPDQVGWGPFTPSSGVGRYLQVVYAPSTTKGGLQIGAIYTLWIPDNIKTVRAVIVHQHGASIPAAQAGATSAYDLHWQALAKKWNCVLLGPSYHVLNDAIDLTPGGAELWFDPRQGSDRVFLRALDEFATKSGHAEIATVPWCLWGHSGGGIWANVMSILHPDLVLAAFLRSGTSAMFRPRHEFIQPEVPPAVYEIPTIVNFGIGERGNHPWDGSIATFQEYRAQGAPIGFATAPVNVRANSDANHGNEIIWEAEADIVSGLGGFIVLRDGRGIAKLPMQPPEAVYGRPLFQGLSYHDTPFAPLPQMRHVDISAQLGAKHVYTVIALSSAGVPSMPSLPAAVE